MDEEKVLGMISKMDGDLFTEIAEQDFKANPRRDLLAEQALLKRIKDDPRFKDKNQPPEKKKSWVPLGFTSFLVAAAALLWVQFNIPEQVNTKGAGDLTGELRIDSSKTPPTFEVTGIQGQYFAIVGYSEQAPQVLNEGSLNSEVYQGSLEVDKLDFEKICVLFSNSQEGLAFVTKNAASVREGLAAAQCWN